VSAVSSDGPTSGADPVGYAEAQVLPLRQIHTSDKVLQEAIDGLATAYQRSYEAKGVGAAVKQAVGSASHKVDTICPGATT
jgi:hypothetical protein